MILIQKTFCVLFPIVFFPIMLLLVIAVKLILQNPALYCSKGLECNKKFIRFWRFRSMYSFVPSDIFRRLKESAERTEGQKFRKDVEVMAIRKEGNNLQKNSPQKDATASVFFLTCNDWEKLRKLYASAKTLVFHGIKDFGIVPVEVQAASRPVIVMNAVGVMETVLNSQAGLPMDEQTKTALPHTIEENKPLSWDSKKMELHVKQFSDVVFNQKIIDVVSHSKNNCNSKQERIL